MKEVGGRSRHSGTDSSSRKITDPAAGVSNFTDSSSRKKRVRVVESESSESSESNESNDSESESSDSASETIPAKVDKFHNGTVHYKGVSRGLDVFEFDEYDRFDDNKITKEVNNGKYRWNAYRQSGERVECGSGSNRPRFEIEDDECDLPLSVLRKKHRLSSGKSVRVQGKNGVLKVMVNENKPMGVSCSRYDHAITDNLKTPESRVVGKKVLHRDARNGPNSMSKDASKSKRKSHSRGKSVKHEGVAKKVSKVKAKESRIKRGTSTEKQILREKIKDMLVDAGWTIDYRPRRNRDYIDAVYISPSGTGYWSIIKAYDAFQKEEEGDSKDLRDEVLGKLSRQTQKKTEIEMRNKRKVEDEKEENLNSYGRKSRKIGRCSLLVRDYDKAQNNDGFVPYSGRRTLLTWLIDSGVVHLREHVEYVNSRKTPILQKGWITKDGIHCGCCSKNVSVLEFEVHAGSKLGDPFRSIILESGKSLMQCQIDAWNKQGELERKGFYTVDADGDDPNDDTCGLCGDGGDLICCDGCPSTFHQTCLDLPMFPQGDWFCPNCSCKYCEIACTNPTQSTLLTCHLCQKKYHESCRLEIDAKPIDSSYPDLSFCGRMCHELYSRLQKLVGVKHELDSEFSWSLIHRSELSMDESSVQHSRRVECNSMLAVAMSVMDECFLPFTDRRSGINLIRNVVFSCGSNLCRLNYSSFYTAILERGDEVICAASIRVHGTQLAEMPFIGTRYIYRRQGMCRRLLFAIETALSSLQVEKLMIPAIPEHMDTWTNVFGFNRLEESDKQDLKCMNMLVFPRTDMLKKPLPKVNTDSASRDDATMETIPIKSPSEPKLSGSHMQPGADETMETVPIKSPSEPKLSRSHMEPDADETMETVRIKSPSEPKLWGSDMEPDADETMETVRIKSPSGPKLSGSPMEPDADETMTTAPIKSPSEPKVPGSHMEPDADETIETVLIKSPCEPKLSSSQIEPDVDEITVQVSNGFPSVISGEPKPLLHSNTNVEETDVQNVNSCETKALKVPCDYSVGSDAHGESVSLRVKVKELADSDIETDFSVKPSDTESCL